MGDIYIHIYGTPPSDSPQSILIYCLYMYIYIYIYIIFMCIYVQELDLFSDVLWVVAVHTIKTSWKQKAIFNNYFGENPKGKPNKSKNLEKTNRKQYLETLWGNSIDKIKKTSRKPKKQKTKTFQRMFGLRLMFGFFGFSLFVWFFFGFWPWKKWKKPKFFLFFWINWWFKNCEKSKKLKVFFLVFLMFVALVSFWLCNEKPKKPWVFWFFTIL